MPVANRNPLPNAPYCIDVETSSAPHFAAWAIANRGKVAMQGSKPLGERTRFFFDVLGPPGAFPFGRLGFPTIIEPASTSGDLADMFSFPSVGGLESLALLYLLYRLLK